MDAVNKNAIRFSGIWSRMYCIFGIMHHGNYISNEKKSKRRSSLIFSLLGSRSVIGVPQTYGAQGRGKIWKGINNLGPCTQDGLKSLESL